MRNQFWLNLLIFFGIIGFSGLGCNPNLQNPNSHSVSPPSSSSPITTRTPNQIQEEEKQEQFPIAKVTKILGSQAFLLQKGGRKITLKEGMEVPLLALIETGENTKLELSLVEGRVITKNWKEPILFSSEHFIRMGEKSIGSFSTEIVQIPAETDKVKNTGQPAKNPIFFLQKGRALFHKPSNIRLALRTPQIDARLFGELFMAEVQNQGTWIGVISGVAKLTLQGKPAQTWSALLIRGEQLFPDQVGVPNINSMLDTPEKTRNNYSIREAIHTEPLITEFSPLPPFTLMEAKKWFERQENRWSQYVQDRNELRRNNQTPVIRSQEGLPTIRSTKPEKEINPFAPPSK